MLKDPKKNYTKSIQTPKVEHCLPYFEQIEPIIREYIETRLLVSWQSPECSDCLKTGLEQFLLNELLTKNDNYEF